MRSTLLLLVSLITFFGCSPKNLHKDKNSTIVRLGNFSNILANGMNIYAINTDTPVNRVSENFSSEITISGTENENLITLENGNWNFYGFGKGSYGAQCATPSNGNPIVLKGGTKSVSIGFTISKCSNTDFIPEQFNQSEVSISNHYSQLKLCSSTEFAACTPSSCSCSLSLGEEYGLMLALPTYTLTEAQSGSNFYSFSSLINKINTSIFQCQTGTSLATLNAGFTPLGNNQLFSGVSPFSAAIGIAKVTGGTFTCTDPSNSTEIKFIDLPFGLDYERVTNSKADSLLVIPSFSEGITSIYINTGLLPDFIKQLGANSLTSGSSTSSEQINHMVIDSSGNIYATGYTSSNLEGTNGGGTDIFIMKFDSLGNISFLKQLGSSTSGFNTTGNDKANAISLDDSGNIYVTGFTQGNLAEVNGGGQDLIVAKFNSLGNLIWIKQFGSTTLGTSSSGNEYGRALTISSSDGSIFIAGETTGNLFGTSSGAIDVFVAKLDSSGNLLSQIQVGGSATDRVRGIGIDSSQNVFIGGGTSSSWGESVSSIDLWVGKVDSSFNPNNFLITQLGSTTGGTQSAGGDQARRLTVDSNGNIYIVGLSNGAFGDSESNGGGNDVILAKFDSSLNLIFRKQLGANTIGAGSFTTDEALGVFVDSSGNIYITGRTLGALGETNGGSFDGFVAKFNSSGSLQFLTQLGQTKITSGSGAFEVFNSIVVNNSGSIFVGGYTDGSTVETSGGRNDILFAKLRSNGSFTSITGGSGASNADRTALALKSK